jgi:hypothetical protein
MRILKQEYILWYPVFGYNQKVSNFEASGFELQTVENSFKASVSLLITEN